MSLGQDEINAIVAGRHGNPFAVLGRHGERANPIIRAFVPGALKIAVKCKSDSASKKARSWQMNRIDGAGLFECAQPALPDDYSLEVTYPNEVQILDDPYRFSSWLGEMDHYLFAAGQHKQLYQKLGAHPVVHEQVVGTVFVVWAPNAAHCSVIGDFNFWDARKHVMRHHPSSGLWEIFIPGIQPGSKYKYAITESSSLQVRHRTDPFGHHFEGPPGNASIVHSSQYQWQDSEWLDSNRGDLLLDKPVSVYEVHLPSWMRHHDGSSYNYREIADKLIPHVVGLGFTHVELLPVTEHPFGGSWGYQPIGLYAPMERLGSPDDFRFFVDQCHQAGLGVIMDWVPAHFPTDEHGLARFDGTALYEHDDPRKGFHREWNTCIFNYGRNEVANYLLSNALFWISEYHLDGIRVDAVASMLYLDYSRADGEWIPNQYGGNQNLEAVAFLKELNVWVHEIGGITFAEESTSWPGVTEPVENNGLGFTYKWNMGWMNDVLSYFSEDPINRKYHHQKLTFGNLYAFSENFILPFSHDEVVYGKGSLLEKMPGDEWQRFANLRLLYCFLFTQPGKKLLFMGAELGQRAEWNHDTELSWPLLENDSHSQIGRLLSDLNRLYRAEGSLFKGDTHQSGFQWIDCDDYESSIIAYYRRVPDSPDAVICLLNFTPVVREEFVVGVYDDGLYEEVLNSDGSIYGGSDVVNPHKITADNTGHQGKPYSIRLRLPPLSAIILKRVTTVSLA